MLKLYPHVLLFFLICLCQSAAVDACVHNPFLITHDVIVELVTDSEVDAPNERSTDDEKEEREDEAESESEAVMTSMRLPVIVRSRPPMNLSQTLPFRPPMRIERPPTSLS